jgi:molybdenum cofactor cytidylyltransferase
MKLIQALRVDTSSKISLVGSGGKTSALIRLAQEWPSQALVAATAHLSKEQVTKFPYHTIWRPDQPQEDTFIKTTVITGASDDRTKLCGIDPSLWEHLEKTAEKCGSPLFIESDGSKTKSLKAPTSHEPAIPPWVNHVVVSVGLSVIGKPLDETSVHRPEIYSVLTGLELGKPITLHSIEKMLMHQQGGLKNIPRGARRTVLLNQVDTLKDKSGLPQFEKQLLKHFDSVIIASLMGAGLKNGEVDFQNEVVRVNERIAGIILAAGNSRRMGQSKALMEWNGTPFVRVCALKAISSGLDPILIVAGEKFNQISSCVKDLPVQVIENLDWNEGQSTSLRVGIKSLPKRIGGAIFLLVDQPQIPITLIRKLVSEHAATMSTIILPESGGRRANPVLFDRKTFQALTEIQGDIGGKVIFSKFPVHPILWFDESILLDIDTPEDYQKLLELQ